MCFLYAENPLWYKEFIGIFQKVWVKFIGLNRISHENIDAKVSKRTVIMEWSRLLFTAGKYWNIEKKVLVDCSGGSVFKLKGALQ